MMMRWSFVNDENRKTGIEKQVKKDIPRKGTNKPE